MTLPRSPDNISTELPGILQLSPHIRKHQTMLCCKCQHDPCHHVVYGPEIHRVALECGRLPANTARRTLYRTYTIASHGRLGAGNHIKIPACIVELIHELRPEPTGDYMGHRWE